MEQLEDIIIKSIETLRISKKQPNEETIHSIVKKEFPELTVEQLKEQLNKLLQEEKILNKPHGGKNSYYIITNVNDKNVLPETPRPTCHSLKTPRPLSHPPETPVRKARISSQPNEKIDELENDKIDMTENFKEYVKNDTFETFYKLFLEFRNSVDSKFEQFFKEHEMKMKKTFEGKIEVLENDIKNLHKENQDLKQESKSYLKIIQTLVEGKNIDAPWQTASIKSNSSKAAPKTDKDVLLLTNRYKDLEHHQVNENKNLDDDNCTV